MNTSITKFLLVKANLSLCTPCRQRGIGGRAPFILKFAIREKRNVQLYASTTFLPAHDPLVPTLTECLVGARARLSIPGIEPRTIHGPACSHTTIWSTQNSRSRSNFMSSSVTTLPVPYVMDYTQRRMKWPMNNKVQKIWKWSWPNLMYYPDVCLQELRIMIKKTSAINPASGTGY